MDLDITRFPYIAVDSETTGLDYPKDEAFGISIATPDRRTYYYDLRTDGEVIPILNAQFGDYTGTVICHNASFDYRMLDLAGVYLPIEQLDDTVIRECCLDEHALSYSLDDLALRYLGERKQGDIYYELSRIFGGPPTRKAQIGNLFKAPKHVVAPYAEKDALLTLGVWEVQNTEAERQSRLHGPPIENIWAFERWVMPYLIKMEINGIRVNIDEAQKALDKVDAKVQEMYKILAKETGRTYFNVNSTPQVREFLAPSLDSDGRWVLDGLELESTKKGNPSLGADALRRLAEMGNRPAELIYRTRSLIKTRDTFLRGHVLGHAYNGRVYPSINQTKGEDGGTGTGRLSYQNPAMQQIPSRDKETASIVKPVFLPESGHKWLDADESSFEVRVFAHLVAKFDPSIVKKYQSDPGLDFHQYVADLTGLRRNATYNGEPNAKQLNLSMIFNQGPGATADKMGMPWEWAEFEAEDEHVVRYKKPGPEAMEIINRYHSELPGVRMLQNAARDRANDRGFVFTSKGRRLRFPNGWKTYKASGLLIQATAADWNKENIVWASQYCKEFGGGARLVLNTHDSYSFSVPPEGMREFWEGLKTRLESSDRSNVPLLLDLSGIGDNWWEAVSGAGYEHVSGELK